MSVKVAIAQIAAVAFDADACIDKMAHWARKAAGEGAELLVFPEAVLPGYPASLDWGGESASFRANVADEEYARYWNGAIELTANGYKPLQEIARANNLYVVAGIIEKEGGTLYCTSVIFGPDGAFLGKHRKLMPTVAERLVWGRGDGSTLPVIDTSIGKIGTVLCWENYMPLLRSTMYAKGVQLYCAPTADDSDRWFNTMQHIAFEGGCFVISACQYSVRTDFPADYGSIPESATTGPLFRGGSCIVGPDGEFIVKPNTTGETLLTAELDFNDIVKAKYKFDSVGHYSRPDVFRLVLNESEQTQLDRINHQ